jgi:DNA-binding phage protein
MIYMAGNGGIMKSIGKEIRGILKKKGISLYQVAKDLGISWESLYRSLQDKANPEWKRIRQILDYLDYDVVLIPKRKEVKPKSSRSKKNKRR